MISDRYKNNSLVDSNNYKITSKYGRERVIWKHLNIG